MCNIQEVSHCIQQLVGPGGCIAASHDADLADDADLAADAAAQTVVDASVASSTFAEFVQCAQFRLSPTPVASSDVAFALCAVVAGAPVPNQPHGVSPSFPSPPTPHRCISPRDIIFYRCLCKK